MTRLRTAGTSPSVIVREPLELRVHGRLRVSRELQLVDLALHYGRELLQIGDDGIGAEHVLARLADGGRAGPDLAKQLGLVAVGA